MKLHRVSMNRNVVTKKLINQNFENQKKSKNDWVQKLKLNFLFEKWKIYCHSVKNKWFFKFFFPFYEKQISLFIFWSLRRYYFKTIVFVIRIFFDTKLFQTFHADRNNKNVNWFHRYHYGDTSHLYAYDAMNDL